ncbi:hypothetical protein SAMN05421810_10155 [Amycolatopsis arida]|uniref:Uncharacterized protein n=1 Tax=Amycolatopsis arida TaxID=587909 RepID=A0A1I5K9Q1_9PSEU|nr:hypothetical protein [Amycolatopsis arida]TDX96951.1 hypothetical protein CLV69_10253 [Amycolatopsis arida]SFO81749.1 hypothetical protein SAMN05421810_10155 [Amycolatopsis arida]
MLNVLARVGHTGLILYPAFIALYIGLDLAVHGGVHPKITTGVFQIALFVVLAVAVAHVFAHRRERCRSCQLVPLPDRRKAIIRHASAVRWFHRRFLANAVLAVGVAVFLASYWVFIELDLNGHVHRWLNIAGFALTFGSLRVELVHETLRPWCPHCAAQRSEAVVDAESKPAEI